MTDARIELTCPGCSKRFHVPSAEQGKIAECRNCGGWVDVPELGRAPTTAELDEAATARAHTEYERQQQEGARQLAESARQQVVAARQLEQFQTSLDRRDRLDERHEELLVSFARVVALWEQLAEKMGRVLDQLDRR